MVAGPNMWNNLPKFVRLAGTLAAFQKQLKTYLFSLMTLVLFLFYTIAWFKIVLFETITTP